MGISSQLLVLLLWFKPGSFTKTDTNERLIPVKLIKFEMIEENTTTIFQWSNNQTTVVELWQEDDECIYRGSFKEEDGSRVLVTGCEGEDRSIQIQSLFHGDTLGTSVNGSVELLRGHGNLLMNDTVENIEFIHQSNRELNGMRVKREYVENLDFETDFPTLDNVRRNLIIPPYLSLPIRVYLSASWTSKYGGFNRGRRKAKQIFAHVRQWFMHRSLETKFGIRRLLNSDFFHTSTNLSPTSYHLDMLQNFVSAPSNGHAAIVYLTATTRGTLGIAYTVAICSTNKKKPRSISKWTVSDIYTAQTVAHEIGHNLGYFHDFDTHITTGRTRSCGPAKWSNGPNNDLMNYASNSELTQNKWSECSNEDFRNYFGRVTSTTGSTFCLETMTQQQAMQIYFANAIDSFTRSPGLLTAFGNQA